MTDNDRTHAARLAERAGTTQPLNDPPALATEPSAEAPLSDLMPFSAAPSSELPAGVDTGDYITVRDSAATSVERNRRPEPRHGSRPPHTKPTMHRSG